MGLWCVYLMCEYVCVHIFAACREPKVSELVRQRVLPPQAPFRYVYHCIMLYNVCTWVLYIIMLFANPKAFTHPKGCVYIPLASASPLRKTPVHKLYSSGLGRLLQSDGPTKGPPVVSQLPQGFHHLYSLIEYECASPFYQHSGSSRRTCLKTGKWSGRHVSCSPGEGSRGPLVISPPQSHRTHTDTYCNTVIYTHISIMICGYRIMMWSFWHGKIHHEHLLPSLTAVVLSVLLSVTPLSC